jgi:hypothetical protein
MTKPAQTDPLDRLDRLADLAAAIEIGLIGLRQCNLEAASHGFGRVAGEIHDELQEVIKILTKEENEKLRVVGGREDRS